MDTADATYWIAACHLAVGLVSFLLTYRPVLSIFHMVHLYNAIAFGIRPMLAASVGGYTNYPISTGLDAYNQGLLNQLVFILFLSGAYAACYLYVRPKVHEIVAIPSLRSLLAAFLLGMLGVIVLHIASGGAWLPSARTAAIDVASPGAKYIFPLSIIALSAVLPMSALAWLVKAPISRPLLFAMVVLSLLLLSLLYVRGMVISALLLILWLLEKNRKLRTGHIIAALGLVFVLGNTMRPVAQMISVRLSPAQSQKQAVVKQLVESLSLMDRVRIALLYTTNNDLADSWPVVISYVHKAGLNGGASFAAIPARFAGTRQRLASGLMTASDLVNSYYYGDSYSRLSFGLNVTLANELYMSFGAAGMLLGVIPGLLIWATDRWMMRMRVVTSSAMFLAYVLWAYKFTSEPAATVQWIVGALVVAFIVEILARLRLYRPCAAGGREGRLGAV